MFNEHSALSTCPAKTGYLLDVSGEIMDLSTTVLLVYVTSHGPPLIMHYASCIKLLFGQTTKTQCCQSNIQVTFNNARL
jgi:hypothetical protein